MASTVAKNKKDVDEMSANDRYYDSLSYAYGKKGDVIAQEFAKARSQADNQALSRGMQRSSYNNQTLANLSKQQIDAQNDNQSALIADYEKYLANKEENEAARQFQREERLGQQEWQSGENALNRAYQTSERLGQQEYQSGENALNRAFQTSEREGTQAYNTSERIAQQGYNTSEREAQQAWQSGENAANRAFQTSERLGQQEYQSAENAANRSWQSGENAISRAFSREERLGQQEYNTSERLGQQSYNTSERLGQQDWQAGQTAAQQAWQSGENALNRAENRYEFDAQMGYQQGRDEIEDAFRNQQYADSRSDTAWQQAFSERQFETQLNQWREEFDYNKMSDTQKIAFNVITSAIQQGNNVPDETLEKAGITRAEFNAMSKEQFGKDAAGYAAAAASAAAKAYGNGNNLGGGKDSIATSQSEFDAMMNAALGYGNGGTNDPAAKTNFQWVGDLARDIGATGGTSGGGMDRIRNNAKYLERY